jgi:hypothetical protein
MKNALRLFIVTICVFAFAAPAMAQSGNQPPLPVTVTNTPANPVPVVGTLNGTVTLTNSPTVKIDPSANTVVVAPVPGAVVLNTGVIDISAGGYPSYGPFNVANYSEIRIIATNYSDSDGNYSFYPSIMIGGLALPLDDEGGVTLSPGEQFSRVYRVFGSSIKILVGGNGSNRHGVIAVLAK